MKKHSLTFFGFSLSILVGLSGCGTGSSVQVNQTGISSETTSEVIRLNNCGNPASAQQVSTRSQAITIQGGGKLGIGYEIIEASISGKYSDTRTNSKSQTVTAAPNTNMEFVLLWTEQVNTGIVTVPGRSEQASYRVAVPLQVELASASNHGCGSVAPSDNSANSRVSMSGEIWKADLGEAHKYQQRTISDKSFNNFSFEADVKINDSTSEYHGLMFGLQSNDKNFYSFRITQAGSFAFDVWQESPDSTFKRILGPANSGSVRKGAGQVNHLKVVANRGRFDLIVNNQNVGTITDTTYSSGKVGFVSCTCDGAPNASATFMNATVIPNSP